MNEKNGKISIKSMVLVGMCAAMLAIMSQIAIPLPMGMPITMQTFAIALTGVILGHKLGTFSVAIYILVGAVGVPVFANFKGGLEAVVGKTGGFLFGFLIMVFVCGLGSRVSGRIIGYVLGFVGLGLCHIIGVLQFSVVTGFPVVTSFLYASAPFLLKDIISIVAAYIVGIQIRKRLDMERSYANV